MSLARTGLTLLVVVIEVEEVLLYIQVANAERRKAAHTFHALSFFPHLPPHVLFPPVMYTIQFSGALSPHVSPLCFTTSRHVLKVSWWTLCWATFADTASTGFTIAAAAPGTYDATLL